MIEGSGNGNVPVTMRPAARYFVGRLLMLRERLSCEQWHGFAASADVICDLILRKMPIDNPESVVWDNRHQTGKIAPSPPR